MAIGGANSQALPLFACDFAKAEPPGKKKGPVYPGTRPLVYVKVLPRVMGYRPFVEMVGKVTARGLLWGHDMPYNGYYRM